MEIRCGYIPVSYTHLDVYKRQVLTTAAADCNLSGTGRVSVTSEYISGTPAVSLVETSTSDDLEEWSDCRI